MIVEGQPTPPLNPPEPTPVPYDPGILFTFDGLLTPPVELIGSVAMDPAAL